MAETQTELRRGVSVLCGFGEIFDGFGVVFGCEVTLTQFILFGELFAGRGRCFLCGLYGGLLVRLRLLLLLPVPAAG